MLTLKDIAAVDWEAAARTYGNAHATLIGLLVSRWVGLSTDNRALEGGPSDGGRVQGSSRGWVTCDALLLGNRTTPTVVLEVEGVDYEKALRRIGCFFKANYPDLKSLQGAILCAYVCAPRGRGKARAMPPVPIEKLAREAGDLLARYPDKRILLVAADKVLDSAATGIRTRNEYYRGTLNRVTAVKVRAGTASVPRQLYPAP